MQDNQLNHLLSLLELLPRKASLTIRAASFASSPAACMLTGVQPFMMLSAVGAAPVPATTLHPVGTFIINGGPSADVEAFIVKTTAPDMTLCFRRQGPHLSSTIPTLDGLEHHD